MKKINLALIGYGNVGKAFVRMLKRREDYIADEYGCTVEITAVSTKRKGSIIEQTGLYMEDLDLDKAESSVSAFDVIDNADYDVLVELTPINIKTGQPAIEHIQRAMRRGKHVITANKGPIAWAYKELKSLAEENNVLFYHEATVMDGAPVYNLMRETLMGCEILEIKGILNATTNYVLKEMENGVSLEAAIKEGQRRGFVEADSSMDIDGWDAAAKLTALMNVLMNADITPVNIQREGIGNITKEQLDKAAKEGKKIKLLCHGKIEGGKVVGSVKPQLVDVDSLYAAINGTASLVTIRTDLMGEISIIEEIYEPEIDQTAYGILSDLFRLLTEAV